MKLVRGKGNPKTGACWMSAWSHFAGEKWSDRPLCVDPVIRSLCIAVNDQLPSDAERERVIGPHFAAPGGTNQGLEVMTRRAYRCLDISLREWLPKALRPIRDAALIVQLRGLAPIVDDATARAANAYAIANANANAAEHHLLPLVLELCAMGEKCEVPQMRSLAELP